MNRSGIIYMATSKTSGKSYIGQTVGRLSKRINDHETTGRNHNRKYKFVNAIRKYGINGFVWEILYNDIPGNQLRNMEVWAIANYNTQHSGYNTTEGGESFMRGRHHTEETKAKIRDSNTGKKHSEATKKKISESKKGRKLSEATKKKLGDINRGKKRSEKIKKQMSASKKGENNHQAKLTWEKVNEIREKYASGKHIHKKLAKEYSVSQATISRVIKKLTWIK